MKGIITKYPITITARSITGNSEVRLRRELQTVPCRSSSSVSFEDD